MAEIYGASLTPIYNRLNSALQYHPLDAETFADWSLEAGDVVTFTRDGTDYETPVYSTNLKWRKKQEISVSSTGQEKRTSIAKMSQRKFSGGKSGLINTQRTYELIETSYNGMRAGLELSSSAAKLYVDNMYTQMSSGLELTASTARLYVNDAYNQMKSGLALSTSSAKLYVDNKYAQMQSGLMLTASSAWLYVDNKYAQMQSGLTLTASTAKLYVDNKYLQMKSGLELTSSSAMLYAQNRTTRAYIMTRINANDEGEALISADKIRLDGDVTLSGALNVITGGIASTGNIQAGLSGGNYIRGTSLKLIAGSSSQGATEYTMTGASLGTTIKNASINENDQLVLEKYNGDTITFSRAASTGKFSGSWSGSTFTVTADPNGKTWLQTKLYGSLVGTGDVSKSGKWVYRNFIVYEDDEGSAGKKLMEVPVGINATNIWNDGWDSAYGCVSWPQEGTGITFNVGVPKSDRTGSESKTFTITKDTTASSSGYAYVSLGGTTVGQIGIGGWYTAGQNAVTLTDGWKSVATLTASRTYEVKTSGRPTQLTKSKTVYLSVGTWSSGSIPIYIRDGSTSGTIVAQNSVSLPSVSSTTWKNTTGKTWRADLSIGGVTRSSSTKDFSSYYTEGYNAAVNDIHHITLDSANNHVGDWWNCIIYNSSNQVIKSIATNQSSTGLHIVRAYPTLTSNGNFKPNSFGASVFDGINVNVSGGSSYAHSAYLTRYYAGVNAQIIPGQLYRRQSNGTYAAIGTSSTYWFGTSTNIGSTKTVYYN